MCGFDFDLILTNTLSKGTVLKDDLDLDSDGNSFAGLFKQSLMS